MKEDDLNCPAETSDRDSVREAIHAMRRRFRRATDDPLQLELLEDDLREGQRTLEEVQAFFEDVLALLARSDAKASEMVDLADDKSIEDQLDYLVLVTGHVRRRLLQHATRRPRQ